MALSELLVKGHKGYFWVDPSGLRYQIKKGRLENREIQASTEVAPQTSLRPNGWMVGVTHHKDPSVVFIDLTDSTDQKLRNLRFKVVQS